MGKRICFIVASEITVTSFLIGHIRGLSQIYDVSIAVNTQDTNFLQPLGLKTTVIAVPIERKISLLHDLRAVFLLLSVLRKEHFDAVHSLTPKAGLLGMVASLAARVPFRIHTFTGQLWATKQGFARRFFKCFDRIIAASATHVLVDSYSQRDFIVKEGVVADTKAKVLGDGSICGVDTTRFSPDAERRSAVRSELGIGDSAVVFLYLGRLAEDKGLLDLASAFEIVCQTHNDPCLVLVGPDEEDMRHRILQACRNGAERIRFVNFTSTPERFMAAADVFCLPSYREGFGMAVIEAAAAGIPAIASRIYGVTDAVEENVTGLFHEPHSVQELSEGMSKMIDDPAGRTAMGQKARERVVRLFSSERVTSALLAFYKSILEN